MLRNPETVLIVVVALLFAIGAYQLVINKYYWGPKGPPRKKSGERNGKRGDTESR